MVNYRGTEKRKGGADRERDRKKNFNYLSFLSLLPKSSLVFNHVSSLERELFAPIFFLRGKIA